MGARAKRQQRIADEFENGRSFAATEGFSTSLGANQKSIAEVQRAVNALSDAGAALSAGNLGGAQSAMGGGWVRSSRRQLQAWTALRSSAVSTRTSPGVLAVSRPLVM